jgi:hypothetical protein
MWLGSLILLAGCSIGGAATSCGPWKPVLVSRGDVLIEGTARQLLAHNETGRRLCGW